MTCATRRKRAKRVPWAKTAPARVGWLQVPKDGRSQLLSDPYSVKSPMAFLSGRVSLRATAGDVAGDVAGNTAAERVHIGRLLALNA